MASLGNIGVSSLLRSAASAADSVQSLNTQRAGMDYEYSAKTPEDFTKYATYLKSQMDPIANSASVKDQMKYNTYYKTLQSAQMSHFASERARSVQAIQEGGGSIQDKIHLLADQYNTALAQNDLSGAQSIRGMYDSAMIQYQNEQTAAANHAQAVNNQMAEANVANAKDLISRLIHGNPDGTPLQLADANGQKVYSVKDLQDTFTHSTATDQMKPDYMKNYYAAAGATINNILGVYKQALAEATTPSAKASIQTEINNIMNGQTKFDIGQNSSGGAVSLTANDIIKNHYLASNGVVTVRPVKLADGTVAMEKPYTYGYRAVNAGTPNADYLPANDTVHPSSNKEMNDAAAKFSKALLNEKDANGNATYTQAGENPSKGAYFDNNGVFRTIKADGTAQDYYMTKDGELVAVNATGADGAGNGLQVMTIGPDGQLQKAISSTAALSNANGVTNENDIKLSPTDVNNSSINGFVSNVGGFVNNAIQHKMLSDNLAQLESFGGNLGAVGQSAQAQLAGGNIAGFLGSGNVGQLLQGNQTAQTGRALQGAINAAADLQRAQQGAQVQAAATQRQFNLNQTPVDPMYNGLHVQPVGPTPNVSVQPVNDNRSVSVQPSAPAPRVSVQPYSAPSVSVDDGSGPRLANNPTF